MQSQQLLTQFGATLGGLFQAFLIAHIVCAVVGFGGLLGRRWQDHQTPQEGSGSGRSILLYELAIYGVPIFGAGAVGFDDRFDFSQIWITLGFLFYVIWLGIWHVALRPRRPQPDGTPTSGVSSRVRGLAYGVSDLLLIAAIWVMVVKPGGLS